MRRIIPNKSIWQQLSTLSADQSVKVQYTSAEVLDLVGFTIFMYIAARLIYLVLYVAFNNQGHVAMGSFTGGGNQRILHCKPSGIGK